MLPMAAGRAQQASVHEEDPQLQGSRPIETQTHASVIRDYIESWKTLEAALNNNDASLLDSSFVGTAHDKLANTVLPWSTAACMDLRSSTVPSRMSPTKKLSAATLK